MGVHHARAFGLALFTAWGFKVNTHHQNAARPAHDTPRATATATHHAPRTHVRTRARARVRTHTHAHAWVQQCARASTKAENERDSNIGELIHTLHLMFLVLRLLHLDALRMLSLSWLR